MRMNGIGIFQLTIQCNTVSEVRPIIAEFFRWYFGDSVEWLAENLSYKSTKKKRSLCGRLKFVWLRTANVGRISQSTAGRSLFCKLVDEDFGCVKARFMPTLLKFTIFWLKPPKFSLSEWTTQSTSFFSNTYSHLLLPKIFWDKCDISSKETQSESSFLAEYQLAHLTL